MRLSKALDRYERIKAVEKQYQLAGQAIRFLEDQLQKNSTLLTEVGFELDDLRNLKSNLLDTYFVRLFAEFETTLRDYWKNGLGRGSRTRTLDVINALASKHKVPEPLRTNVDAARKWRNRIVHESDSDAALIDLAVARRDFNRYLNHLPGDW